ncbi:MAG: hypothetical protein IKJ69_06785 [Clostridia bacterium]|nr:hypothetical protein [Clostridia bacterium]
MLMKKFVSAILCVVTLILCLAVPVVAVSEIKLTDEVYPTEIIEGSTFSVYGIVTSSNNLVAVTIGVYRPDGSAAFDYTGRPGTKSYDIHVVDYLMTFSKLEAGDYVYKIVASDTVDSDVVLLEKEFKVLSKDLFDTMKITSANAPDSLLQGNTFSVKGNITSDYKILAVTCSVRSTNGTLQFTKTVNPNTNTYDISEIDRYMTFSRLQAGTYVYKIVASDTYNKNKVLLERTFTVTAPKPPTPGYGEVVWDVIDLSVWNEIRSWDKIADNVDAVILRIGYRATGGSRSIGSDKKFLDNYKNAKAQGLPVGCYFFSAALTASEAVEEAKYVLSVLNKNNCTLEMPVYFDIETDAQVALSSARATEVARAFCEEIEKGGFYTGIYCNKFFARDELYANQLSDYHFWIAQYASECTYDGPYGMWQYSENGSVPGIQGDVDLNFCYYDYPKIIKGLGMSGNKAEVEPKPPVVPESFSFKETDGAVINESTKIISGIPSEMKSADFTKKYLTLEGGATVSYSSTVSGLMATGTKVKISGTDKVLGEFTVSVVGDTDMNAKVNSTDALVVLQFVVGGRSLGPARQLSADITGDGAINSTDALKILRVSVGK